MPEVSRAQFLKANPNQQALPGMEKVSHPGAALLSQGYSFSHESTRLPGEYGGFSGTAGEGHTLMAHDEAGKVAGYLQYPDKSTAPKRWGGLGQGEIAMVETHRDHRHKGIATALYGIGREMARVKPRHSTARTNQGDPWAKTTVEKFGGRVPKKNTLL